jgi:hypothetical protein
VLFSPRIRDPDPGSFYPGSGKLLSRIRDPDPGCFYLGSRIRDGAMVGSGIKHPGSAALLQINQFKDLFMAFKEDYR